MKILIADKFESWGIEELKKSGFEVAYEPGLKDAALRDAVASTRCAVLIVRSTVVGADALGASPHLSLVLRAGAGYNTIDVATASRRGILVANCPGKNAIAVAELTFALILALDRRIVENVVDLRAGQWNKKEYSEARGLKDRTLGVIGTGQIGRAVIDRARAFEMNVVAWSRSLTAEAAAAMNVRYAAGPAEVAERCDILTIHLAAATETLNLINADVLNRLRPGSYVINTARADVLDYAALAAAVRERKLRAAVDVFPGEPKVGAGPFVAEIMQAGGVVYGTHHIGASTEQAQNAIAAEAVRLVRQFRASGVCDHCVNVAPWSAAGRMLIVRHHNQPGVLAHVLTHLSRAHVNVEHMENVIVAGEQAAYARICVSRAPDAAVVDAIRTGNEHVLAVELLQPAAV
ncbi:MAG: hydroxyacid dehydrogenase [Phycisphaerae bacterium]|nr:NAD(P)-binding domain-containing protein [Phycisphaerae bacterium]NUQ44508.1 hydroxyacid dehydrogenase [Phycisphaerae bacterium]